MFLIRICGPEYSTQFVNDLSKFEHSAFPENPARRTQGATCESFTASCRVAHGDGGGTGIESDLMRSGMSPRAVDAQVDRTIKPGLLHLFGHRQQGARR